jgi:hypothetical protein
MSARRVILVVYVAIGILTLLFQTVVRLRQCAGFGPCALSLTKGVLWSGVWPAYWIAHWDKVR